MGRSKDPKEPNLATLLGLGTAVAALVIGGMGVGAFADSRLGSFPVGTLIGLGLGIVGACSYAYVQLKKFLRE